MDVFDEHQGGQLRIGAPGDPLELFPLADAGIPDVGHVVSPAENELERRAAAPEFREVFVRGALRKVPLTREELADRQRAHYVNGGPIVLRELGREELERSVGDDQVMCSACGDPLNVNELRALATDTDFVPHGLREHLAAFEPTKRNYRVARYLVARGV